MSYVGYDLSGPEITEYPGTGPIPGTALLAAQHPTTKKMHRVPGSRLPGLQGRLYLTRADAADLAANNGVSPGQPYTITGTDWNGGTTATILVDGGQDNDAFARLGELYDAGGSYVGPVMVDVAAGTYVALTTGGSSLYLYEDPLTTSHDPALAQGTVYYQDGSAYKRLGPDVSVGTGGLPTLAAAVAAAPTDWELVAGGPVLDIYGISQAKRNQVLGLFTSASQFKAADVALSGDTSTGLGSVFADFANGDRYELLPDPTNPDGNGNATPTWLRR